MKTTRDSLLVVFVSLICIVQSARCGAANVLEDRNEETEEIEELVRKEVFTSLRLLGEEEEEDDIERSSYTKPNRNGNQESGRYYQYQLSNRTPIDNLQASGNSYKIPEYSSSSSYYSSGSSKPFNENGLRYGKTSGNSDSPPVDYRYKTGNHPQMRSDGNSKTARSSDLPPSPAVSAINTREPDDYTIAALPWLGGGGRLYYGGSGYNGGGLRNGIGGAALRLPGGLIRRGIRRLGRLGGGSGGGSGSGSGPRYGMLGGAGLRGMHLGFGGSGGGGGGSGGGYYADYSGDGVNLSAGGGGGGRQGYYGNGRYGSQGNYDGSGSGGSWTVGGGSGAAAPTEYYNLRYGYPAASTTVSASVDASPAVGGSRRYAAVSYPNDFASTGGGGGGVSITDGENPTQYELMFLRNQSDSPNRGTQTGSNRDSDLQITTGGSASGANRDTSNGAGYRVNLSGGSAASSTPSTPGAVEEYRLVVVNKDSPANGSGRNGISSSTSGSIPGASGSASWSVSSSATSGSGSSAGRSGQGGFQITTPITSTRVSVPPSSIVGSVLSTVQGAVTGDQTRSPSTNNDSSTGKIIQFIPVKSSN